MDSFIHAGNVIQLLFALDIYLYVLALLAVNDRLGQFQSVF